MIKVRRVQAFLVTFVAVCWETMTVGTALTIFYSVVSA